MYGKTPVYCLCLFHVQLFAFIEYTIYNAYQCQCHWRLHEQHRIVLQRWLKLHNRSPDPGPCYPDTMQGYPIGTCREVRASDEAVNDTHKTAGDVYSEA